MRGTVVLGAVAFLLCIAMVPVAQASWGMPDPMTERGQLVHDMYVKITIAGVIVFLIVFVWLVILLLRFREGQGNGKATHERHRGSMKAEAVWTIIPLAIVLWVGVIAYQGLVILDEEGPAPEMTVAVTGYQWAWELDYGQGAKLIVTASPDAEGHLTYSDTFHLPADTAIGLDVRGADVIHAFNIIDANRAWVSMNDANPSGPHNHNLETVVLPAGDYVAQCKEMCLNPGHAYMRAPIKVEPKAQFNEWLKEKRLEAGKSLISKIQVTIGESTVTTTSDLTFVKGTRVIIDATNPTNVPVAFFTSGGATTIPAHGRDLFAFDLPTVGETRLSAGNGGNLTFHVIDATAVQITLGNYEIIPPVLQLKVGTTYLVQVQNVHTTTHNIYFGHHEPRDVLAASENIAPGGSTTFTFTPTQAGTFDTWCDVAGHHGLGMHATMVVS